MTKREVKAAVVALKEFLGEDENFVREAVRTYVQEVLEHEMTASLVPARGSARRRGLATGRGITSAAW